MKTITVLILILMASMTVGAQQRVGAGMAPSSLNQGGGGGGYGGGPMSFDTLPESPQPIWIYDYVHGSFEEYIPSVYMPYDDAVKLGQTILNAKPKTLGEIAAEYRAAKTLK